MKALLIDPKTQTVTVVEVEKGIDAIYKAIDADLFECPVELPNGDTFYCDEEGKLTHREKQTGGFTYEKGWHDVIVGKTLILGLNPRSGNSVSCISTPEQILNTDEWGKLVWVSPAKVDEILDAMGF